MQNKVIIITSILLTLGLLASLSTAIQAQEMMPEMGMKEKMNQMMYDVMIEDKAFQVMMMSDYDLPETIEFSQEQRSISLECKNLMMMDMAHFEITIPNELLSGEFTATLGGKQIKLIQDDKEMETTLHENIMKSFIEENGIGDSAMIVVTGTEVIPEFPIGMMMVLFGAFAMSTALILIGRKRIAINVN